MRRIRRRVHHPRQRLAQDRNAGAGLDGIGRDMPPEGARARHGVEEPEDVARDGVQPHAARQLALDVRDEGFERGFRAVELAPLRRRSADRRQKPPRLLIGRAAHHHAIDVREVRAACSTLAMPPLMRDVQSRMRALEAVDAIVVERRDIAVFPRREPVEPRLAGVHDQRVDTGRDHTAA